MVKYSSRFADDESAFIVGEFKRLFSTKEGTSSQEDRKTEIAKNCVQKFQQRCSNPDYGKKFNPEKVYNHATYVLYTKPAITLKRKRNEEKEAKSMAVTDLNEPDVSEITATIFQEDPIFI